ncbi:helix-turn-helix domain-containing protein [Microbacterium aurum]
MQKARNLLRDSGPLPVDLEYLLSNNSATPVTADKARQILAAAQAGEAPLVVRTSRTRPWTRLSPDAQSEVVRRYSSGETSTALAEDFKVAKSTILRILRENSVVVRRQPLTGKQVSMAKRLYESGLSLSEVADQMFVNQETMRGAIVNAGVELRPPTGGRK